MPMSPRLLRPRASGFHPEAQDWRNRVIANGGTVSGSTLTAVSRFCRDIDAAGIRDRFYRLNLFCGDQLAAALVPLYRAESRTASVRGNATDTNTNFVSGDFNNTGSSAGLKGNGSNKHLNTGYPANTLAASNTHMGVGVLAAETVAADKTALGAYDTAGQVVFAIDMRRPSGATNRLCAMGLYSGAAESLGFFGEAGNASAMATGNIVASNGTQYRNGGAVGTTAPLLTNFPQSFSFYLFANNNGAGGGAAVNHTNARIGSYSFGASMTASQALAYSNAITSFNAALSRT